MYLFLNRLLILILGFQLNLAIVFAIVPLPSLNADESQVSVSGISSGGFMAVQLHIAHSKIIKGVGVFAGGPYYCSKGSFNTAVNQCMQPHNAKDLPAINFLINYTKELEKKHKIDPLENLLHAKVYIFAGKDDVIVSPLIADLLESYYLQLTDHHNILLEKTVRAGHAMITNTYGNTCASSAPPYINNCNYDGAGKVLEHIYGPLNKPVEPLQERLIEFDQSEFVEDNDPQTYSLAQAGWAYIPKACERVRCRVHIFLHGCKQNTIYIGKELIENAGYNRWAEANRIILLYPQTSNKITLSLNLTKSNPFGCWDWWGYTNVDFYSQHAPQIKALVKMIDRLIKPIK